MVLCISLRLDHRTVILYFADWLFSLTSQSASSRQQNVKKYKISKKGNCWQNDWFVLWLRITFYYLFREHYSHQITHNHHLPSSLTIDSWLIFDIWYFHSTMFLVFSKKRTESKLFQQFLKLDWFIQTKLWIH